MNIRYVVWLWFSNHAGKNKAMVGEFEEYPTEELLKELWAEGSRNTNVSTMHYLTVEKQYRATTESSKLDWIVDSKKCEHTDTYEDSGFVICSNCGFIF